MKNLILSCVFTVVIGGVICTNPSYALDLSGISNNLPGLEKLDALEKRIEAEPKNLDHYFQYAKMATQLHEYEKAATMYERILRAVPRLPRIKLELAMIYMKLQRFDEAENLVEDILQGGVPEQVRKNLEPIIAQLDEATRRHRISGSLATGIYYDTNANAAPESGIVNIRINGQELPFELDGNSDKDPEAQAFIAANINHEYRHPTPIADDVSWKWDSSATYYQNEYNNLDELNVNVASVRTGPTLSFMNGKVNTSLQAGYTHIILDNHTFQRQYLAELSANYVPNNRLRLEVSGQQEFRDYSNSPTSSVFEQRNGDVQQLSLGATYVVTPTGIIDITLSVRHEDTKRQFLDNSMIDYSIAYTRQFSGDIFTRVTAGLSATDFDAADPSISSLTRKEKEGRAGLMIGKTLKDNITLTFSYEYRDVEANITNFSYDNHRLGTTIGKRF